MKSQKLSELFLRKAESCKENICIHYDDVNISYSSLLFEINRIKDLFKDKGVKENKIIAVYMPRSLEAVISILSIMFLGCAYLPIDIRNPINRVKQLLKDSGAACVITNDVFFSKYDFSILSFNISKYNFKEIEYTEKFKSVDHDVAYLMYTSGFSGISKGVLGTHTGMINRINWMQEIYPIKEDDVCMFNSSISFVDSVAEIFSPLIIGAKLCIIDNELSMDPIALVNYIKLNSITRILLGNNMLDCILEHGKEVETKLDKVNLFAVSGSELYVSSAIKFREMFPNKMFINLYGSTEVSADALYYVVPKNINNTTNIAIGKPINNMRVTILSSSGLTNQTNIEGEICLQGIGVSRGYIDEKNENFRNGDTYYTGDSGYIREDGNVIYLGRLDDQVKINGQKVHLKEIERVSLMNYNIKNAVSISLFRNNVMLIILCVQYRNKLNSSDIYSHLGNYLPKYMMPNKILFLDVFPTNASGKNDYQKIKEIANQCVYKPCRTILEENIAEIFKKILKLEKVGYDSDFWELGGSSLTFIWMVSNLNQKFKSKITYELLENNTTVERIAHIIKNYNNNQCKLDYNYKNTIILFPSIYGSTLCYNHMVKNINNCNIVSLDSLYSEVNGLNSIEEIATIYVEYIASNFVDHNIALIGWSFGGVLAYEVSRQISLMGLISSKLFLLDSYNPVLFAKNSKEEEYKLLASFIADSDQDILSHVKKNIDLLWKYRPKETNSYIILLKSNTFNYCMNNLTRVADNGWKNLSTNEIEVISINIDHFDILLLDNIFIVSNIIMSHFSYGRAFKSGCIDLQS